MKLDVEQEADMALLCTKQLAVFRQALNEGGEEGLSPSELAERMLQIAEARFGKNHRRLVSFPLSLTRLILRENNEGKAEVRHDGSIILTSDGDRARVYVESQYFREAAAA